MKDIQFDACKTECMQYPKLERGHATLLIWSTIACNTSIERALDQA